MPTEQEIRSRLRDVGVARFNRAHESLVELILEFHRIVGDLFQRKPKESDWQRIDDVIKKLFDYTVTHFRDEESLMERHGYPGLVEHRNQHKMLMDQLETFNADFSAVR